MAFELYTLLHGPIWFKVAFAYVKLFVSWKMPERACPPCSLISEVEY